jgi:vacuolar-type H+-ATPase subunit E/Vma4
MSLESLENEIASAAKKEVSGIASRASEEAERIISEAKATAKERLAAESASLERLYSATLEEAKSSMQITANTEISKRINSAAEKNYRKVHSLAEKRVLKNYGKFIKAALAQAEPLFKGAEGEVVVEADAKAAKELKGCKYQLQKSRTVGVVIRSRDGKVRIDSTLSGALDAHSASIQNLLMASFRERAAPLISEIHNEKETAVKTKAWPAKKRKVSVKHKQKAERRKR